MNEPMSAEDLVIELNCIVARCLSKEIDICLPHVNEQIDKVKSRDADIHSTHDAENSALGADCQHQLSTMREKLERARSMITKLMSTDLFWYANWPNAIPLPDYDKNIQDEASTVLALLDSESRSVTKEEQEKYTVGLNNIFQKVSPKVSLKMLQEISCGRFADFDLAGIAKRNGYDVEE